MASTACGCRTRFSRPERPRRSISDRALYEPGRYVEQREQHTNDFIVGNERTGLWKKAFGLAQADELIKIVASVLEDEPATTTTNKTPGGK